MPILRVKAQNKLHGKITIMSTECTFIKFTLSFYCFICLSL